MPESYVKDNKSETLQSILLYENIMSDSSVATKVDRTNYCNILLKNLEDCSRSGMYDCDYLSRLLKKKM